MFIVGSSLFAETLAQILEDSQAVTVVGNAPTLEAAMPSLERQSPDAVILAGAHKTVGAILAPLLVAHPNLPIIHADLSSNQVQVITHQPIDPHISSLLEAIAALPRRRPSEDEATPT